jgi:hypothetical protein
MPKPRRVKAWVYLAASLLVALVLLAVEYGVLSLFVNPGSFNRTLFDIAIYPAWALNAFPAGYILRSFGFRVHVRAPTAGSAEGSP